MTTLEYQKEFERILITIDSSKHSGVIFGDFLKLSALSISNSVCYDEEREKHYLSVANKYNRKDLDKIAKLLAITTETLRNFNDFLGELYLKFNFGDKRLAQCFTPYCTCRTLSSINIKDKHDENRIIAIQDPACGSGALVIAAAEQLSQQRFDFQKKMFAVCTDLSEEACYMCYIQLSLLGLSAVVVHGNSLTGKVYAQYRTPFELLFNTQSKYEAQQKNNL